MTKPKILGIYIWVTFPQFAGYADTFAESLAKYPSDAIDWLVAVKDDSYPVDSSRPEIPGDFRLMGTPGTEIGPMRTICREMTGIYDFVIVYGAYSRILGPEWDRITNPKGQLPDMMSYMGSHENGAHLRTAAFGMKPHLFDELWTEQHEDFSKKHEGWNFESGANPANPSMYRRMRNAGYTAVQIDKNGWSLESDWPNSATWRSGDQRNLLVADKQSDIWQNASPEDREYLTQLTWHGGSSIRPSVINHRKDRAGYTGRPIEEIMSEAGHPAGGGCGHTSVSQDSVANFTGGSPEQGYIHLEILQAEGLEPHHRVLEIGCGGLYTGLVLMEYLDADHYCAIDPNAWARDLTIYLGDYDNLFAEKHPRFSSRFDFDSSEFGEQFDFIFSSSILSHASATQLGEYLRNTEKVLAPNGKMLASFFLADPSRGWGDPGTPDRLDSNDTEWVYPGRSYFTWATMRRECAEAGFSVYLKPEYSQIALKIGSQHTHDWLLLTKSSISA